MALYLLIRVGTGITDTATATLVALNSNSSQQRAANLGLIQSTRAAARIVTPVLSGSLFSMSCLSSGRFPGSLPYVVNAVLALALTPLPLLLKKLESRQAEER
jgi:fucose permease